jgi:hypothetical protein
MSDTGFHAQGVMRSVGLFLGSVVLMRLYGDSMAV